MAKPPIQPSSTQPSSTQNDMVQSKQELRRRMRLSRAQAFAADKDSAQKLRTIISQIRFPKPIKTIAAYMPIGDELDCQPAFQDLIKRGYKICLPVVAQKHAPLVFKAYELGGILRQGPLHTLEPALAAKIVRPDMLLMPLLGYDRSGNRLGQGGGYYDRTLEQLRAKGGIYAIGLAFEEQRVTTIPTGEFDQSLDGLITPFDYVGFSSKGRGLVWQPKRQS